MPDEPTPTATATRPGGPADEVGDPEAWRQPRHLGLAAAAVIVVLVATGWLVHWWGPLNPALTSWASAATLPAPGDVQIEVQLRNDSRSAVTLTDVDLAAPAGTPTPTMSATQVVAIDATGGGPSSTDPDVRELPTTLDPGETVQVRFVASLDPCNDPGWSSSLSIDVVVDLRSDWGRSFERSIAAGAPGSIGPGSIGPGSIGPWANGPCPVALPPEAAPPADRAAAAQQVADAFGIAYDANLPADLRQSRIEDGAGVEAAVTQAPAESTTDLAGVRAVVTDVSFDRPGHATVAYRIEGPVSLSRTGEAVLVEGQWLVARATVCADLALAEISCPPPPP